MRKLLRKILRLGRQLTALAAVSLTLALGINAWIVGKTADRIELPEEGCTASDLGIIFGTSHYLRSGQPNPHYYGRIDLAARLYHDQQIKHLLVSGDNRTRFYNEPRRMQQDLIERGIPESAMTLDPAGISTFDTLKRAKEVFKVDQALLITQDYHLPRAVFIAQSLNIDAQGCTAAGPEWSSMKNILVREAAARLRTLGDLYIWRRQADQLGEPQPLNKL